MNQRIFREGWNVSYQCPSLRVRSALKSRFGNVGGDSRDNAEDGVERQFGQPRFKLDCINKQSR